MLLALGALALAGCDASGDGEDAGSAQTQDGDAASTESGAVEDGAADTEPAPAEPVPAPTEPADIDIEVAGREASQGDGEIFATGAPVAFTSPTGNISCVMTPSNATCQVPDKTYTASSDQLVGSSIGSCAIEDADAMILSEESGAWTCPPEPLAPIGALTQGGWWAAEIGGDTLEVDGIDVAVLPYGNDLRLGSVSCTSSENGVTCDNSDLGKQIFISRTSYRYG